MFVEIIKSRGKLCSLLIALPASPKIIIIMKQHWTIYHVAFAGLSLSRARSIGRAGTGDMPFTGKHIAGLLFRDGFYMHACRDKNKQKICCHATCIHIVWLLTTSLSMKFSKTT
jgi:hypothetical protein